MKGLAAVILTVERRLSWLTARLLLHHRNFAIEDDTRRVVIYRFGSRIASSMRGWLRCWMMLVLHTSSSCPSWVSKDF